MPADKTNLCPECGQAQDDWEVVVMVRAAEGEATKVLEDVSEFIYAKRDFDATVVMRREEPVERPPRRTGLRDSVLLFIGAWIGMVMTLLILGLMGAIK